MNFPPIELADSVLLPDFSGAASQVSEAQSSVFPPLSDRTQSVRCVPFLVGQHVSEVSYFYNIIRDPKLQPRLIVIPIVETNGLSKKTCRSEHLWATKRSIARMTSCNCAIN